MVGLCEALPECGGYKVHKDKLVRMGVPIYTSPYGGLAPTARRRWSRSPSPGWTPAWKVVPGTEKTFKCDTVLVAVGLEPVDEFFSKAKEFGLPVYAAGDAEEIAEASAAMFTGKIRGTGDRQGPGPRRRAKCPPSGTAPPRSSRPGPEPPSPRRSPRTRRGSIPVFHCSQEIPCNPCTSICPQGAIQIEGDDILGLPTFDESECIACEQCVAVCPGLAITLVDYRTGAGDASLVTVPYEFPATASRWATS